MKVQNRLAWIVVLGCVSGFALPVLAQNGRGNGHGRGSGQVHGRGNGQMGVRSVPPRKMSGLGGVRSQPGVKSAAPGGFSQPLRLPSQPVIQGPGVGHHGAGKPVMGNPGARGVRRGDGASPASGDGVRVSGTYRDGPFTLKFTAGGNAKIPLPDGGCIIPVYTGGCAAVLPYCGVGSYFSCFYPGVYSSYDDDYYPVVVGSPAPAPVPVAAEPAPAPLTPLENAAALLKYGDAKRAVTAYQSYLKTQPNDAAAMRALGLSLIDAGQTSDGIAVLGMAYRSDSTLAAAPFTTDIFARPARFRSNLSRVSAFANREKSASAWLTLAAMMQAEGRGRQALTMVERAKAAGLDEQVVQEMSSALAGSGELSAR